MTKRFLRNWSWNRVARWRAKHKARERESVSDRIERQKRRRLNPAHHAQLDPAEVDRAIEVLPEVDYLHLGNYGDRAVRDLSGLRFLSHLRRLHIERSEIADFSPLAALKDLEELWFHDEAVEDLRPVAALTRLTNLWADVVQPWPDLSGWSNLEKLEAFHWRGNLLALEGLGPFPRLREAQFNSGHSSDTELRDATRLPAMPGTGASGGESGVAARWH